MKKNINIFFEQEQQEKLKELAQEQGLQTATFCRRLILNAIKQEAVAN